MRIQTIKIEPKHIRKNSNWWRGQKVVGTAEISIFYGGIGSVIYDAPPPDDKSITETICSECGRRWSHPENSNCERVTFPIGTIYGVQRKYGGLMIRAYCTRCSSIDIHKVAYSKLALAVSGGE